MKNLIATICIGAILTGCSGVNNGVKDAGYMQTLLVGSYSEPADSALKVYRFNPDDCSVELLYSLPVANASYLAAVPDGAVYSVTEDDSAASMIASIMQSSKDGRLEVMGRQPVGGSSPCYVEISPDGRFVATANYGDGSVSVFPVAAGGLLGERCQLIAFEGRGPIEGRQDCSHAHCIAFTPDGKYMLVNDLGTDRIHQFAVRYDADSLVASQPDFDIVMEPASGPRHIVFNKKGDTAYLINEISDKVTVLRYDGGELRPVQYIDADIAQAHGAGDIHLSPDGTKLYASLRLKHEGIATFNVDPTTGLLTYAGHTVTGGHPRNFTFSPDGRYMFVACRDANAVEIYSVDSNGGSFAKVNEISQPRAVLVKFLPEKN